MDDLQLTTTLRQKGSELITVALSVLGQVGGLFVSLQGFIGVAVKMLTRANFTTSVTKDLFLSSKESRLNYKGTVTEKRVLEGHSGTFLRYKKLKENTNSN